MSDLKIMDVLSSDGSDKLPSQAEMDELAAVHLPFHRSFEALPDRHKWAALCSLVMSVCMAHDEPFDTLMELGMVVGPGLQRLLSQESGPKQ